MGESASQVWSRLNGIKGPLMSRVENYASLTIPKLCLPDGYDPYSNDQTHDFQSIGAQAVNHLTNKIMLALFAPSRPFFVVKPGKKTKAEAGAAGIPISELGSILAGMERDAVAELDSRAQRPKLYTAIRHLIVAGNVLLTLGKDSIRVQGLRYFCVKRTLTSQLHTLVIHEQIRFNELPADLQAQMPQNQRDAERLVSHYKLIERQVTGDYKMSQWLDETRLPEAFDGKWPEDKLPYRVLTWDLADESDYGTGLVEEYSGDFEALSSLAEAVVEGAILGTEYRWLVNPTGYTSADDLNNSKNGDALPGSPQDIAPTQGGNPQAVDMALNVMNRWEQRVARGFLLLSAVTRDAERVTAEEVRLTAQELETAYGGVYSALAASFQLPIAHWLLEVVGTSINGTDLKLAVVTGLDALSRNGDLENLRLAMGDLAQFSTLPPSLLGRIKMDEVARYVGQGRGIDLTPFLMSDAEYQALLDQQAQARVAEASATATGESIAANQGQPIQ